MSPATCGENKHLTAESWQLASEPLSRACSSARMPSQFTDEELAAKSVDELIQEVNDSAAEQPLRRQGGEAAATPLMRELERVMMLRVVDEYWMDHIDAMDELQAGHPACGPTPRPTPSIAYKQEGFEMFEGMIDAIQEETVRRIFVVRVKTNEEVKRERVAKVTGESGGGDGRAPARSSRSARPSRSAPTIPAPAAAARSIRSAAI